MIRSLEKKLGSSYRYALAALLVGACYYVGAKVGLLLTFKPDHIAAFWPPNAILLSALLLSPPRYWWYFLLASIPAELAADLPSGIPLPMSLVFLGGDWVEALTGAFLMHHYNKDVPPRLGTLSQLSIYLYCCVVCAPFVAAFVGSLTSFLLHNGTGYWAAWRSWYLGDALTHLTLTSTIILWSSRVFNGNGASFTLKKLSEAVLVIVLLITAGFITFGAEENLIAGLPVFLYLPLPFLFWIAVRFDMHGIFTASLILTLISIWTASQGTGPFSYHETAKNVLNLQIFLMVALLPFMFLAALMNERKRSQQQLELFRELIDNSNDGIFVIDPETSLFLDVNRTACKRLGYSRNEILKKGVVDINPEFSDIQTWKDRIESVRKNESMLIDSVHARKDGSVIPVEINSVFISLQGKDFLLSVVRDITERKKIEEKLLTAQKLESVGILAGGIAHDFNNLLTAIIGNVSMAKLFLKPEVGEAYTRLVETEKASMRAKDLTQQLLTFSKGGTPVTQTSSIVGIITDSANFLLSGSNIRGTFDFEDGVWPVEVDVGQISQVIQNLVKNAEEVMPQGGQIRIAVRNIHVDHGRNLPIPDGRYVEISVEDEGGGIPKEHLGQIFDPYFTTKQKGSGLGLATAYSIIKKHGGLITADSTFGKGMIFTLFLPASDKEIRSDVGPDESLKFGSGRILVMDDEVEVRNVVQEMVSHLQYDIVLSRDGSEAIDLYRMAITDNEPFDVVILDLTVPGGLGGKETLEQLLKVNPDVKVIVASGYATDPIMAECEKYGFCGVIRKPFKIHELSDILFEAIRQNQ